MAEEKAHQLVMVFTGFVSVFAFKIWCPMART